jgi:hypothetical protein
VFASNVSAKYTIIAAIVDNGQPKILTHVCEYGTTPRPSPEPNPTPPTTLKDWVTQNIPPDGKTQSAALANCYEAVADSINNGTIKTIDAGYALLRSTTQTKIKTEILKSFLDKLAVKISEQLKDNSDVKKLASLFKEIAQGLKAAANIETNIVEENNIEYSENTEAVTNISPHPTEKSTVSTPPRGRTFFPSRK